MAEIDVFTLVVNKIIYDEMDSLEDVLDCREDITPGIKQTIDNLVEHVNQINQRTFQMENNLNFFNKFIKDMDELQRFPNDYLIQNQLLEQGNKNIFDRVISKYNKAQDILANDQQRINKQNKERAKDIQIIDKLEKQLDESNFLIEKLKKEKEQSTIQRTGHISQILTNQQEVLNLKQINSALQKEKEQILILLKNKETQNEKLHQELQRLQYQYQIENNNIKANNQVIIEKLQEKTKVITNIFIGNQTAIGFLLSSNYQELLIDKIQQITRKNVINMTPIYDSNYRSINFHEVVDSKKNVLFLSLTQNSQLVGGFSSKGFSLENTDNDSAFIFNCRDGKINIFKVKSGESGTEYDWDFLLFGHEEICIQKGKMQLSSFFVGGSTDLCHFEGNEEQRSTFLDPKNKENKVGLLNYQMIQVLLQE